MPWRLRVTLQALNDEFGDEGPIPIGRTSDPAAVKAVCDALVAEAREQAEGLGGDAVLQTLAEVESDRMERTIAALMTTAIPSGPRLVPEWER